MVWVNFWAFVSFPPLNCFRKGTRAERQQAGNEEAGGYQWWRAWLCWINLPIFCILPPLGMHRPWYCPSQSSFSAASLCSCSMNAIIWKPLHHTQGHSDTPQYFLKWGSWGINPGHLGITQSHGCFCHTLKQLYFLLGNNNSSFSASSLMALDWINSSVC